MRRYRSLIMVVGVAALLAQAVPAMAAQAVNVSFRTSDGVQISASFYQASRRPAPCVILVHMLTRSKDDWQALASHLADAGISALAIDLRGHGSSGPDPRGDGSTDDMSSSLLDVQAARAFMASRPDVVSVVGIAGAQVGANLAALAAAGDPSIRSIVMLSPGLDFRNVRAEAALRKYGGRPALLVSSEEDGYATRSIRRLTKAGNGTRDVMLLTGAGHGTVMLSRQPDLVARLIEWFQRTL